MKLIIAWTAGIYSIMDVNAIPYLADSCLSALKLSLNGKGFSAAKGCDRMTPTGDHPELEPVIDKVIQLLKGEGLTRGQMHFVLVKVQNRLIYQSLER